MKRCWRRFTKIKAFGKPAALLLHLVTFVGPVVFILCDEVMLFVPTNKRVFSQSAIHGVWL